MGRQGRWEVGAEGGSGEGKQWVRVVDVWMQAINLRPGRGQREGAEEELGFHLGTSDREGQVGRGRNGMEQRWAWAATSTRQQGDATASTAEGPEELEGEEEQ